MTKITIEFQDENSAEFKVDAPGATYRQLLVAARELHRLDVEQSLPGNAPTIEIELGGFTSIKSTKCILDWRLRLVADEFFLAAQHIFFTQQNQAMAQAVHNKQALVALQQGGRANSGLAYPPGVGHG